MPKKKLCVVLPGIGNGPGQGIGFWAAGKGYHVFSVAYSNAIGAGDGTPDAMGNTRMNQFDGKGRPANHMDLSPQTCKALRHLDAVDFTCIERNACGFTQFAAGWAAHTLAHESFHLRGFEDEGVTECYALQNTAFVAARLGVPEQQAQDLQAWLFKRGYPNEPNEYRSPRCYAGGPLDLRPQATRFP